MSSTSSIINKLPEPYLKRMQELLGEAYDDFLASYDKPRAYGLRINTRKLQPGSDRFVELQGMFQLKPVPWCPSGYYYEEETRPGRHPYHAAGVYYIQEPSAMSAAQHLAPQPGELVLDLAAAPGGKSTQIADLMQGQGVLISNEIHPARAQILAENIERMGIANAIVTSASPDQLAARFPSTFDRIMVDAPCSGEGMFRKEPEAIEEWSEQQVEACAVRQMDILQEAVKMLRPGGTIAYSTCTFSREENERIIDQLTEAYPELSVEKVERYWPHECHGEGHFVAVLKHSEAALALDEDERVHVSNKKRKRASDKSAHRAVDSAMQLFAAFVEENLHSYELPAGEPLLFGEQLYLLPTLDGRITSSQLQGIKTPRPGLHLGTVRKNRFEPSHALALTLTAEQAARSIRLAADGPEIAAYLRGETLPSDAKGWTLVTVDGYSIGWGKASGGILKNHYPKGLRRPN